MGLVDIRERILVGLLGWLPKASFSRLIGTFARGPIPRRLRRPLFTLFARRVGARLEEAELALDEYGTLDAFFTRRLKAGLRPMPEDTDVVASPCDGTVSEHGPIEAGRLVQAKGRDYELAAFVGDPEAAERFTGGTYLTIYLAPRDYHRVHFAVDGPVTGFQHLPGTFYPVNSLAVRRIRDLFPRNERLVTYQDTPLGEVATVMVAATGVGNMTVTYDDVETNRPGRGRGGPRVRFAAPRAVQRGDELGAFHLGSTVVLLFEPGRVALEALVPGRPIRLGEAIGRRRDAHAAGRGDRGAAA